MSLILCRIHSRTTLAGFYLADGSDIASFLCKLNYLMVLAWPPIRVCQRRIVNWQQLGNPRHPWAIAWFQQESGQESRPRGSRWVRCRAGGGGGGGWIRLIVDFQPLVVISPTASWIWWCMQVYACELMWTCLVWAKRSTPDNFWVPSHRFNSATGEQKGITHTIYTDSKPPSRMPSSLMPSWEAQTSHFLRLWCDTVEDQIPASRTSSGRSNHYAMRGRSLWVSDGPCATLSLCAKPGPLAGL